MSLIKHGSRVVYKPERHLWYIYSIETFMFLHTFRSLDGNEWAIPQANRLKYNQMFNKEDRKRLGYLTGLDARQLLMSTGLPQNLLAQIWLVSR